MAIDTQKLLPRSKKGDLNQTHVESLIDIKVKIVSARDILKGTLAAEKALFKDQQREDEGEERDEEENKLETPKDAKKAGLKMPALPGASFLQRAKTFIGTILLGFAISKLLKFLPKLMPLVKLLAGIAQFVIKIGGVILKGLINFVDWGYKAHDKTKAWIAKKWGDGAAQKFSNFTGLMTKMMNTIFILGMTTAAFADALGGINPLELLENLKNKKWAQKLLQRGRILVKRGGRFLQRRVAKPLAKVGTRIGNEAWLRRRQLQKRGAQVVEGVRQSKLGQRAGDILQGGKRRIGNVLQGVRTRATAVSEGFGKFKNKLGGYSEKFKNAAKGAWEGMSTAARKKWDEWTEMGARQAAKSRSLFSRMKGKLDEGMAWAGKAMKGLSEKAKAQLMEKLITPFKNFIAPIGKWADDTWKPIWSAISGSPAFKWVQEALAKKGVSSLAGKGLGEIAQRVGAKAIPVLGGFVNLWFARDRWRTGDKFGAGIEGLAGVLDIASAIVPPLGIPALMLDGYMLVRDLVPQVEETEKNLLAKFGSTFDGIKSRAMEFSNKLAGVSKMFVNDKGETAKGEPIQSLPPGTGTTPINVSSVQKDRTGEINGISSNASYEDGSGETVVISPPGESTSVSDESNNGRELAVVGGSTSSNESSSDDAEYFYKKAG